MNGDSHEHRAWTHSIKISGLLQHFGNYVGGGGWTLLSTSASEHPVLGFNVNSLNHYRPQKHVRGLIIVMFSKYPQWFSCGDPGEVM